MKTVCPFCFQVYELADSSVNQLATCPACRNDFAVIEAKDCPVCRCKNPGNSITCWKCNTKLNQPVSSGSRIVYRRFPVRLAELVPYIIFILIILLNGLIYLLLPISFTMKGKEKLGEKYLQTCIETPNNAGKAVYWLEEAAKAGSARASYLLGKFYLSGKFCRINYKTVQGYFQRASEKNYPEAQLELAKLYLSEKGEPADLRQVKELLEKASAKGSAEATSLLQQITTRTR